MYSKTHNCAGACAGALRAGGAEAFAGMPFGLTQLIAVTPNDIERWVIALDHRIRQLNSMTQPLLEAMKFYRRGSNGMQPGRPIEDLIDKEYIDLWSLEDFKAGTNIKSTFGHINMRQGAIANIDNHLAKYHRLKWEIEAHFTEKLRCMIGIVTEAHGFFKQHAHKMAEAKRGAGIALLVRKVFCVLKRYEHQ